MMDICGGCGTGIRIGDELCPKRHLASISKPCYYLPENTVGATHWARLPDDSILFYKITDDVLLWLPMSKVWAAPTTVPYTLNSYDDEVAE